MSLPRSLEPTRGVRLLLTSRHQLNAAEYSICAITRCCAKARRNYGRLQLHRRGSRKRAVAPRLDRLLTHESSAPTWSRSHRFRAFALREQTFANRALGCRCIRQYLLDSFPIRRANI